MILLPNRCSRSEFNAHPKNWKSANADLNKTWYIKYRFYEMGKRPIQKVVMANMNKLKELRDRQAAMKALIEEEDRLLNIGYNPRMNTLPEESLYNKHPIFYNTLLQVNKNLPVGDLTKRDINWMLKN